MRCGNDPRARLTPGDRAAVAEFKAYLARRAAERLAVPCPWSNRARTFWSGRESEEDVDVILAAAELTWCEQHERAVSECTTPPPAYLDRDTWGVPDDWMSRIVSRPAAEPEPMPCLGADGGCMWGPGRCTGMEDTCRCMCPVCVGDTPDVYGYEGDY
jgi:hypothetical protein